MATGPELQLSTGSTPDMTGGVPTGGYQMFGHAPGTSGNLASIFSDKARLFQMEREEEERKAGLAQKSQMDAITSTGTMAIKQADMASKSRELQQAQLKDFQAEGGSGEGLFQNKAQDGEGFFGKVKDTFDTQGVEFTDKAKSSYSNMKGWADSSSIDNVNKTIAGTDAGKALGVTADQVGSGLSVPSATPAASAVMPNATPAASSLTNAGGAANAAKGIGGKALGAAGAVGGIATAAGGVQKIASSKTAKGKTGGALQVAGGLGGAAVAAGLLSGPVGWAAMGAGLLGGFMNDD